MSTLAIRVNNLSKHYRLGETHSRSLRDLINSGAARLFGHRRIGGPPAANNRNRLDDAGSFLALKDVSFDVNAGEVVGVIGRNGAGKSTLLKILSSIVSPSNGRVELHGRIASLLEVGTGFHPELTGRENVFLNGTILGMTKAEVRRKFDEIVAFSGIEQFIDTPVKRYSSGMAVRLGFAVAAHLDPEILIVDEVLAVGDIQFQEKCISKMRTVSQTGRTVLFVSHNMASIRALTTRSLLLSNGELVFAGPTGEAVDRYHSENGIALNARGPQQELARPYSGLTRELDFDFIELEDLTGGAAEEGTEIVIHLGVRGNQPADQFTIGLTIFRGDAIPIGSTFSSNITAVPVGEVRCLRLRLPTKHLTPGRYHCAISITDARSAGQRVIDSVIDVLAFEIRPSAFKGNSWCPAWGAIRLPDIQVLQTPFYASAACPIMEKAN